MNLFGPFFVFVFTGFFLAGFSVVSSTNACIIAAGVFVLSDHSNVLLVNTFSIFYFFVFFFFGLLFHWCAVFSMPSLL